jgi:4a-hydroxytetrahydrobiopterin dehydratase
MKKLDIEQAEAVRKKFAPDWEIRKGKYLYKKVAFDDYNQALRFFMVIEKPQIKLDHFADIGFFYNEVILIVYTHDVGGLTQLDFELALYIDEALKQMGARQLDEKWSAKYKKSINCNNPKGFSQKAHCAGRKKTNEKKDDKLQGFDPQTAKFLQGLRARYPNAPNELSALVRSLTNLRQRSDRNDREQDAEITDIEAELKSIEDMLKKIKAKGK